MQIVLSYAPATSAAEPRRWLLAALGVCLAGAGVVLTAYSSVSAAQRYFGTFGGCGTGRQAATFQLTVLSPMLFALPAAGWFFASRVGLGVLPCRCATWASVAAWATAFACTNL